MAVHTPHSEPVVFPPIIPAAGFLMGVGLQAAWPIPRAARVARSGPGQVLGAALLCVGLAGFVWMVVTMRRARTPIHNARTPTTLVTNGPFALSRNPMYLFGSTAYAGLALLLGQIWSLALLPVVLLLIHFGVVRREERFLSAHFGTPYEDYRRRVRRWV